MKKELILLTVLGVAGMVALIWGDWLAKGIGAAIFVLLVFRHH